MPGQGGRRPKVDAVYVTDDSTLIMTDFAVPRTSKLQGISARRWRRTSTS